MANENYATDYAIGDTKMLDLGTEGKHLMEIVAFDADDRADGTGKAGITWISKDLLNTKMTWQNEFTTAGGWEASAIRSYLKNTIKPLIPETVRNNIVNVSKVSSTYEDGARGRQTTTDDVWIPGSREIHGGNGSSYESLYYGTKFASDSDCIKKRNADPTEWWLRSASSKSEVYKTSDTGNIITGWSYVYTGAGVAIGFCTN